MSFIVPGGELYLFKGVPLDNNYDNVFRFPSGLSSADIGGHFLNAFKYTHTTDMGNLSYQRVDNQTFKVNVPAWEHYDDNYLMFRNNGNNRGTYGYDRWYFGFITDVLYINDNCTQFTYEIDWITTWLPYCEFEDCFIERCTPETDEIGDNILQENITCGDYKTSFKAMVYPTNDQAYYKITAPIGGGGTYSEASVNVSQIPFSDMRQLATIIMICEVDTNGVMDAVEGNFIENTFSGAEYYVCTQKDSDEINDFLSNYKEHPESIVNMYTAPAIFAAGLIEGAEQISTHIYKISNDVDERSGLYFYYTYRASDVYHNIDGYTPANNKLYTYPFNYMTVDNGNGDTMDLRIEFFEKDDDTPNIRFKIEGSITAPAQCRIMPYNYGLVSGTTQDYTFKKQLGIGWYPSCSWASDYYTAWSAQNSVSIGANLITDAIGVLLSIAAAAMTGGALAPVAIAGGAKLISDVGSVVGTEVQANKQADEYGGNVDTSNLSAVQYESCFWVYRTQVNANLAESIDNYFSMFGYAYKKLANPYDIINNNGNYYCYIKTTGCQAGGTISSEAREHIEEIFNKGVRLWDFDKGDYGDLGNIGDYRYHNNDHHDWSIA